MQAQELNDIPPWPPGFGITVVPKTDARLAAEFYCELIAQKVPENVAKDLTIAYIMKQNTQAQ